VDYLKRWKAHPLFMDRMDKVVKPYGVTIFKAKVLPITGDMFRFNHGEICYWRTTEKIVDN
jgi:hypothetical protein